jgi:hypothetical protein
MTLLSKIIFIVTVTFSSVYWIFTKLGHMIALWKGKNPIYFGVFTIIPFDNLYRRAYFVMHTFLDILFFKYLFTVKIQYTELKLSCRNDPVVKKFIYSNGDLDL